MIDAGNLEFTLERLRIEKLRFEQMILIRQEPNDVRHSLSRSPGCSQSARAPREEFVIENLTKLAEHARSCGWRDAQLIGGIDEIFGLVKRL